MFEYLTFEQWLKLPRDEQKFADFQRDCDLTFGEIPKDRKAFGRLLAKHEKWSIAFHHECGKKDAILMLF